LVRSRSAPKVINDGTSWGSGYAYGFRIPILEVSPYPKAGYVSHVPHDFGSILNLIERTFSLAAAHFINDKSPPPIRMMISCVPRVVRVAS
jgi:phospholipase C